MTDVAQQTGEPHPVADYLKSCGIEAAAIIDDAYDPPTRESLGDAIPEFWDRVIRNQELLTEFQGVAPAVTDQNDIDNAILKKLFEEHEKLAKLGPLCKQHLFSVKLEKLAPLRALRAHLEQAGLRPVLELGTEESLPADPVKLVFLDYFLGAADDTEAVKAATAKAEEIYRHTPADADKPFIVLMSSKPDAEAGKETFREASKLLSGLFGFVRKAELKEKEKLYLHLWTWAIGMPARHEIQHFVEAMETGVKEAASDFIRRVRALGFEDYANIQWLSLQAEGHPLGDYMLWLYKSLFAYLLHGHTRVLEQQEKLDAMSFEEFTPSPSPPSPQLAEIYRFAITEPGVKDVGPHPKASPDSKEPLLQTGDVFFKADTAELLLVINAPSDLAYSPGSTRPFPKERPILLVHGTLQRHEVLDTSGLVRTELFEHDRKPYRILWDHKRVMSQEYGKVWAWLKDQGFSRKARLSFPYALEVQQTFAMHVMRPSLPIRPPTYRHADVEIYCAGDNGDYSRLDEPIVAGAWIMRRRKADKDEDEDIFVLTPDCIGKIVGRLQTVVSRLETQMQKLREQIPKEVGKDKELIRKAKELGGKIEGLQGKLQKLNQLQHASKAWVPMVRTPRQLAAATERTEVDKQLLWVYHERTFEGTYREGPPIVLNLRPEKFRDASDDASVSNPAAGAETSTRETKQEAKKT